jgi:hypothetical protein
VLRKDGQNWNKTDLSGVYQVRKIIDNNDKSDIQTPNEGFKRNIDFQAGYHCSQVYQLVKGAAKTPNILA